MTEIPATAPSRRGALRFAVAALAFAAAALAGAAPGRAEAPLKVGTTPGPFAAILHYVADQAKRQGQPVEIVEFTDWITPNEALASGDIDANLFQHVPFLQAAIKARGYDLVPVAPIAVIPVGLFSKKIKRFDEVPDGAQVAIANDPVNGARGLQLFAKAGLITLKPGVGDDATVADITANPKGLRFLELEAAQLPRALEDVVLAQVSLTYLVASGGDPQSALIADGAGDAHYALNIVVRGDHRGDPRVARFVAIYRSQPVKDYILAHYGTFIEPAW